VGPTGTACERAEQYFSRMTKDEFAAFTASAIEDVIVLAETTMRLFSFVLPDM
jgi:hypothetical protein